MDSKLIDTSPLISTEKFVVPAGFHIIQDNEFSSIHCSNSIELSNYNRTARIKADAQKDNLVKTVMGTYPLERREKDDPSASKYYVLLNVDEIDSTCICVGI